MTTGRVDLDYLAYQYGDAEKLRARIETHSRYSELPGEFRDWLLDLAGIASGVTLLDLGCGPGAYHRSMSDRGARVAGADTSPGMAREVLAQARAGGLPVSPLVADAQSLPLRDASFDRVLANHMLYHVPDRERALREMRRVLKPGGRAVLATNAADNYARLDELHGASAREHGFAPTVSDSSRFTLDDLPLVRAAFPSARVYERRDALVFPDTAPALRFYASYRIDGIEPRPPDGTHRPLLLASMERRISEIVARDGVFRVPKSAGCFVADV